MGQKAHTILILVALKREGYRLVHRSRKVFTSRCEHETRAFIRAWNLRHHTKTLQVWDRASQALREF